MSTGRREIMVIAALLSLGGATTPLQAQEAAAAAREGCRCVDRAGEEIPSCFCVVTPDMPRMMALAPLSRLGVEIDWEQGDRVDRRGARIEAVTEGSPAEEAGLRAGDVLVSVAGRHLLNPLPDEDREAALDEGRSLPVQRLLAVAGELEAGEPVEVRYLRDGQERATTVVPEESSFGTLTRMTPRIHLFGDSMRIRGDSLRVLGDSLRARLRREHGARGQEVRAHRLEALTREHQARARELAERMGRDAARLRAEGERVRDLQEHLQHEGRRALEYALRFDGPRGVAVSGRFAGFGRPHGVELVALNPDLADYFEVEEGVLVADVAEDSGLGLRPGDVIVAVGEREVENVSDVRRILASYDHDEEIRFRVVRRGDERTVTGRLHDEERPDGS